MVNLKINSNPYVCYVHFIFYACKCNVSHAREHCLILRNLMNNKITAVKKVQYGHCVFVRNNCIGKNSR